MKTEYPRAVSQVTIFQVCWHENKHMTKHRDAYQKYCVPIQNFCSLVSIFRPCCIEDRQERLFVVATGLLSHTLVNGLSKQLNVCSHDILHDDTAICGWDEDGTSHYRKRIEKPENEAPKWMLNSTNWNESSFSRG